jgi:hypothetical protein
MLDGLAEGLWPSPDAVRQLREGFETKPLSEAQLNQVQLRFRIRPTAVEMVAARVLAAYINDCPVLMQLMAMADRKSLDAKQVAHGHPHAVDVSTLTLYILNQADDLIPGVVTELDRVVGPIAGSLHDSGRLVEVKRHAQFSAIIADWYLPKLASALGLVCPEWLRKLTVMLCMQHQSNAVLYRTEEEKARGNREINYACHAALLIADKLCGSEARVTPENMELMEKLKAYNVPKAIREQYGLDEDWSIARICWNRPEVEVENPAVVEAARKVLKRKKVSVEVGAPDRHDHMNGAIRSREILFYLDAECDETARLKGTMLYRLQVETRIAPASLLTDLDWWDDALHTAAKAGKFLGFRFQLEFNGQPMVYSKPQSRMVAAHMTRI